MRLTMATHQQLEILVFLYRTRAEYVSTKLIASELDLPVPLALKFTTTLVRLGLLEGKRGGNGGVRLAVAPAKMRLGKTITLLEANNSGSYWERKRLAVPNNSETNTFVDKAFAHFVSLLDTYTLHDLVCGAATFSELMVSPPRRAHK